MSPFMVLTLVSGLAVAAVAVLAMVVMGIRSERSYRMSTRPQGLLDALVRRLLGVYVGRSADTEDRDDREECLTGQSADWWNKGGGTDDPSARVADRRAVPHVRLTRHPRMRTPHQRRQDPDGLGVARVRPRHHMDGPP